MLDNQHSKSAMENFIGIFRYIEFTIQTSN